jgi:hypothetical protein
MKIDDLVQYVRLETPGVMDLIIVQAVAATAMDFCDRTKVWDEIQDPIPLFDGINEYDMEAPKDARVLTIGNVWVADGELTPITMPALAQVMPNWQSATASKPIYYNAARDWKAITVFPTPLGAQGARLTFRAQYAPLRTSTTLPDFLAERFHDALVSGTKSRLMMQVNVPWSNLPMGAYHLGIYEQAVTAARIEQLHARVPSAIRVRSRSFQ